MSVHAESGAPTVSGRRYLTILFCDLVGSTQLAEKLDPEVLQDVQERYHGAALAIIERFGGFVQSFAGDGILAYFGYPLSRENDAERAVRAGLEVIAEVKALEVKDGRERLPPLSARIGIHTGLVVVGSERASGGIAGHAITGEAVNLASRIEAQAAPDSVAISGDTLELVEGIFECEPLGMRSIRGLSRPVALYRVTGARTNSDLLRRLARRGATKMVGRSHALGRVIAAWERTVAQGKLGIVSIAGEAGVGKTRLALEACQEPGLAQAALIEARCHELFANAPLHAAASFLWGATGLGFEDGDEVKRAKVAELLQGFALNTSENVAILASLLGVKPAETLAPTPQLQKEQQFALLIRLIASIAKNGPTVLWIEDSHWLDPSSAEIVSRIVSELSDLPLFVLMTSRLFPKGPELPPTDETVQLSHLATTECLELAKSVPGAGQLSEADLGRAVEAAEGIPLFVEQLVLELIDKGGEHDSRKEMPLSLAELMADRLDRLPSGRATVQAAACIGRSFTAGFLAKLLKQPEEDVTAPLEALVGAEILKPQPEGGERAFEFRHALLQRMAHESMTAKERRALHAAIADLLQGATDFGPAIPELVAHHLTEAARTAEAIEAWRAAGAKAAERSAHVEAVEHLKRGLALLPDIDDETLRRTMELSLQAALIGPLTITKGSTSQEFSECCRRGLELCRVGGPTPLLFPFLFGGFVYFINRGQTRQAADSARTFLAAADAANSDTARVIGYRLSGMAQLGLGDAARARADLEKSLALYNAERDAALTHLFGQNTQVHSRALLSLALLCLGEIEDSLKVGAEALAAADASRHPHSTAIALGEFGGLVLGCLGAADEMMNQARRLIALSEQHRLGPFRSFGSALLGWAFCLKGDFPQGISLLEQALAEFEATHTRMSVPAYLANLADAKRRTGRLDEAASLIGKAKDFIDDGVDPWLEPEVLRIDGLIAHARDPSDRVGAEARLRAAIASAQRLGFPLFEFRCLDSFAEILGVDEAVEARRAALSRYRNLAPLAARALRRKLVPAH